MTSDVLVHDVGTLDSNSGARLEGPLTGFDTPTLKGLWETAPYLHNGKAASLNEVFTQYNQENKHGKTSQLSESERDDLIQFLLQIDESRDALDPDAPIGDRSASSASYVFQQDNNMLQIRFNTMGDSGPIKLVLRNLTGKKIWKENFSPAIDGAVFSKRLAGLPKGVLVLEIRRGGLTAREKWVRF